MKISDLFRFSADNLRRRVGRTILTVIGVVVGVCAIVVMMSLGIAVNRATDEMLQSSGDLRKISVSRFSAQYGTPDLDDDMVAQFKEIPHVVASTPIYQPEFYGSIVAGKSKQYMTDFSMISGMETDAIEAMEYKLLAGEYIDPNRNYGRDKIPVMVGSQVIFDFYDTRKSVNNPNRQKHPEIDWDSIDYTPSNLPQYDENGVLLNPDEFFFDIMKEKLTYQMNYGWDENTEEAKTKEYEFVVVGILDSPSEWNIYDGYIMRIEDVQKLEKEYKRLTGAGNSGGGGMAYSSGMYYGEDDENTTQVGGYDEVYVKVDSVNNMPDVEKTIKEIGYRISSMSEWRDQLQGQVAQTQMMLGGLAAVSLFVAALNIMNTMTMAIYERTREIGVMKVLGCKLNNIRTLFLIESGAIGLIGGIFGVVLSFLISLALNYLPAILTSMGVDGGIDIAGMFGLSYMSSAMPDAQLSIIPVWLVLLALGFAMGVGLLSGIAPANRAVRISSLEAIRHE